MGRLPDFLIIGAMKCGTTSLHDYLGIHPELFVSNPKEVHYFTDDKQREFSIEWYKAHFDSDKKLVGTSPQNYTKRHNKFYQGIPRRISKVIPDVKLIYIMRDPIKRLESHIYENLYNEPPEDLKYNISSGHYIKTGMYYYQIKAYLPYFSLENIHFMTLEDLVSDKLTTLNKLFLFLGVSSIQDDKDFAFASNSRLVKTTPYFLNHSRLYRVLSKRLPVFANAISDNRVMRSFQDHKYRRIMRDIDHIDLRKIYSKDTKELRALTGLPFDKWSV